MSADFVTMYTTLPHADLIARVSALVEVAFDYEQSHRKIARGLFLCEGFGGAFTWKRAKETSYEKSKMVLSLEDVRFLIAFVVNNTYVLNGDVLRRQVVGIPMGTNCAPLLANLYCHSFERAHMDRMWVEDPQKARRMRSCFRLIDDLLAVNCPDAKEFFTSVYPCELKLERTNTGSDHQACFLGMEVKSVVGKSRLSLTVFDKRKSFPFKLRNYPHLASVIPKSQAYGVFTGQLHRFHRICTLWKEFVKWAVDVGSYMSLERGYSRIRLWEVFAKFCFRDGIGFQGISPRDLVLAFKLGLVG